MEAIQVATRIQLRRDLEDDWFNDNPILYSGEIAISLDLNTFKIGDGQTPWRDLDYALSGTLEDYIPLNTKSQPGGVAALDSDGKVPDSQIPAGIARDSEVSSSITAAINNLVDGAPGALDTLNELAAAINDDSNYATTLTSALATKANLSDVTTALETKANSNDVTTAISAAASTAASDATSKANAAQAAATAAAATDATAKANAAQLAAETTAAADATAKANAAQTAAGTEADTKVSNAIAAITKSSVGLANVDNTSDANKPVSTAQATAIANAKSEAIADATSQVNSVIASAPAALNTLDELAAALGDDASFAATITSSLTAKAPLESPTFTGTVSGITKTMVGLGNVDNTSDANKPISSLTQTALNAKSDNLMSTDLTTSTNYSISSSDLYKRIEFNSTSPTTVTIPADITLNLPIGSSIELLQANTGKITVQGESVSVLIYGPDNQFKSRVQWSSIFIEKRAANSWLVTGDTEA
jgi:hypothetical protein